MGRLRSGTYGPLVGKLGNVVNYIWRGLNVNRMVSHPSSKPATLPQLISRKKFSMSQKFVAPLKDFVAYSFHPETKGQARIPQNAASALFRKHAITGEYPDFQIDYSKVIVSKGKLPAPVDAQAQLEGDQLSFSWAVNPNWALRYKTDQVMMLAYFPDSLTHTGRDGTKIKDTVVETYLAFISNDRQEASDSIYCGRFSLPD